MRNGDDVWVRLLEDGRRLGRSPAFEGVDDADLEREVRTQAVVLTMAMCRWLEHLAEFIVRDLWAVEGMRTPADWLSWALGIAPPTAREHVRVALRLRECPQVLERFRAGRLSYSKVRAITRICVPAIEGLLLQFADAATARDLERIVAGLRRVTGPEPDPQRTRQAVSVDWRWDDDGLLGVHVRLEAEDGLAFIEAMDRLVDVERRARRREADSAETAAGSDSAETADGSDSAETPADDPVTRVRADVLLDVVTAAAADDAPRDSSGQDRHVLVLHADFEHLTEHGAADSAETAAGPDSAESASGGPAGKDAVKRGLRPVPVTGRTGPGMLPAHVLRRLACDGRVGFAVTGHDGNVLEEPAPTDIVPVGMRRAMLARDHNTCRFPGCGSTRHLHAHHVIHRADNGPTVLSNLTTLCAFHHRFIHAHRWELRPVPGRAGRWTFHKPGGVTDHPAVPNIDLEGDRWQWLRTLPSGIRALPDDLSPTHWLSGWDLNTTIQVLQHHLRNYEEPQPVAA